MRAVAVLAAALLTAACVTAESWEAVRVLRDIEARGGPTDLKAATPEPVRREIRYGPAGELADLYDPRQPVGGGLVLVPGFTPHGKDDGRVVDLAASLARARFLVMVPDLPGSRGMRVRPEDAGRIAAAAEFLARTGPPAARPGVGVAAISYAVGLAVLATAEPGGEAIAFVAGVGGYHDTDSLALFITTGRHREGPGEPWLQADVRPAAKWLFLASHLDVLADAADRDLLARIAETKLDDEGFDAGPLAEGLRPDGRTLWALVENRDPVRVPALLARLPVEVRTRMRELSLRGRDLRHLAGRLILIHGREDGLIPYTESQALARAVPGTELFLIDGFSHIDPDGVPIAGQLRLADAVQAILARRHAGPDGPQGGAT